MSSNLGLIDAASYADGRIALLVGNRTAPYARSVVRLDTAGRIDTSFSVVEALPGFSIDAIAVTGDSRLVALQSYRVMPDGETRITRHLEDGSLDPAFGVSGNALVSRYLYSFHAHLGESGEFSSGLAVEPSGRTYTVTTLVAQRAIEAWVTRVGASGNPVEKLNRSSLYGYGPIRVVADGAIVALMPLYERVLAGGPKAGGPALIRLVDGAPDAAFGIDGIAFHPLPNWFVNASHGVYDFALTPDGGYVVAGVAQLQQSPIVVVKFTPSGAVDVTFGEKGVASLKVARPDDFITSVKLSVQPDGRVVVASTIQEISASQAGSVLRVGLGRLTADGKPDGHFAGAGTQSFWVEGGTIMRFLSVQPDGRIIVAGDVLTQPRAPSGQSAVFRFLGGDSARFRPLGERRAVEYFHKDQGHYFVTAEASEIIGLDVFNPNAWVRTGSTFRVWDDDSSSLSKVCRFWSGATFAPKSSHFYTPEGTECTLLKAGDTWLFEGNVFELRLPEGAPGSRVCGSDSQPLYRVYNNGAGGAPNHRFTTSPGILDEMIAKGWTMEGEAQTRVFACVPPE